MRMSKKIIFIICILSSLFYLGCGGSSKSVQTAMMEMKEEAYYEAAPMEPMAEEAVIAESGAAVSTGTSSQAGQSQTVDRKLIKTVDLSIETDQYDKLMVDLEKQIHSMGGYIEYKDAYHGNLYSQYENRSKRNASLTVRIPSERLEEFTGAVSEIGNITYESESVEDVTLQYVDLSSHKKMLQTQQDRLLELLETAETMEDIIALEGRLSEVRYEIESMESQLRTYDNLVEYSTVHLNIQEVERYTPMPQETIKDRILTGLSENTYEVITGIINFGVELIISLPILILIGVLLVLGFFIIKGIKKVLRRKNNKETEGKSSKRRFGLKNKKNNIEKDE